MSAFFLVLVTASVGAYRKPDPTPKFQAVATLIVKPDRPALVNIRGGQPFYQEYFNEGVDQRTQLHILKSRAMMERLVSELDLTKYGVKPGDEERVLNRVSQSVQIIPVSGTYLVRIIATEMTPEKAIQLANTMAEVYIEYNMQTKLSSARKTLVWLNEQIVDLRSKVQDSYEALSDFQEKNKVLSLEMAPEVQAAKLAELNGGYERAKQERIVAETRLAELQKIRRQGGRIEANLAMSVDAPALDKLREDITATEIERTGLLQSYKEKHPKIKQLDVKLDSLRQNLMTGLNNLFQKLETNVSVLRSKESNAADSLTKFKQDAVEISTKRLEYSKLKGEVTSTEELYNLLFRQLKETSITGELVEKNTIRILESARTSQNITTPLNRGQITGFGGIIGLLLGVGLAFLFEYFDKTIKTPEDIEMYLGLPVLGTIPKIDKKQKKIAGKSSSSLQHNEHYALQGGE
ncbi:MAG: GumC family protein [bacterium]|nr:GumC family protein [bacterium]